MQQTTRRLTWGIIPEPSAAMTTGIANISQQSEDYSTLINIGP